MRTILISLLLIAVLSAQVKFDFHHPQVAQITKQFIERFHFNKQKLDDNLSEVIFWEYLKNLDYNKAYLLKSDVDEFEKYKFRIDDGLKRGTIRFAAVMYNRYAERFQVRISKIIKMTQSDFDFNKDEYYNPDREDVQYAVSEAELDEYWRKRIKNEALRLIISGKSIEDTKDLLKKRYENQERYFSQFRAEDVYTQFINAYLQTFDPHTNYLPPAESETFNIRMRLSLEGIGAILRTEYEYTKVASIVQGGPADKQGELQPNDRILAVAQGIDGEYEDVIGWRIDDVVAKIRGKKGTTVRLRILPAGAKPGDELKDVVIVRDKVQLKDRAAKSKVIDVTENGKNVKIGVIDLPSFYRNFNPKTKDDERSATADVKRLIEELGPDNLDGLIIDLRNNGGGSLTEAVELTGLFIDQGPVVQIRSFNGKTDVLRDEDPGAIYKGPLAVLVNENSASASEIFSGAIQDYQRGVVIGMPTFGKGTVQRLYPLGEYIRGPKVGQLKFTIQKFYRINGESTQHKGVLPDISFTNEDDEKQFGERSLPFALEWDKIESSSFAPLASTYNLAELIKRHQARTAVNPYFAKLEERFKRTDELISLNLEKRKQQNEELKKERLDYVNKLRAFKGMKKLSPTDKMEFPKADFQLDETVQIVTNMIEMQG